jgi:predicted MFS family arabinose efflux permease
VLFGVYALYYALAEPAEKTLVVALAAPEHKGLALGWFHFTSGVALLPASLIFGWLYEQPSWGAPAAFGWGAVLAFAATLLLFVMPRTSVRSEGHVASSVH